MNSTVILPCLGWQQAVFQDSTLKKNKEFINYIPSAGRCLAIPCKAGLQHA